MILEIAFLPKYKKEKKSFKTVVILIYQASHLPVFTWHTVWLSPSPFPENRSDAMTSLTRRAL